MNMAVRIVKRFFPDEISDGMNDKCRIKPSPFTSSNRNIRIFVPIIRAVIAGKRKGLRSTSLKGIIILFLFPPLMASSDFLSARERTALHFPFMNNYIKY
jgi:hypothetical protein